MAKRKALSKKIRFEVFKRDNFKCQYCGKSAPDVILHVDHINPVSKGGSNDILNLITSCADCNGGKSDVALDDDSAVQKQRRQLEELNERREQLEMMLQWRDGLKSVGDMALEAVVDAWEGSLEHDWHLNEKGRNEIKKLLRQYGLNDILDAIETAVIQYAKKEDGKFTEDSVNLAWHKVPGILRLSSQPEHIRELYYMRGILRKRLRYINEQEALMLLKSAYNAGVSIDDLRDLSRSVRNWTSFWGQITDMIRAQEG